MHQKVSCEFIGGLYVTEDGKFFRDEKLENQQAKNRNGEYLVVSGERTFLAHRLYAQAFIPNPNNYKVVLARDKDYTNLSKENLYWASPEDVRKNRAEYKRSRTQTCNVCGTEFVRFRHHPDETTCYMCRRKRFEQETRQRMRAERNEKNDAFIDKMKRYGALASQGEIAQRIIDYRIEHKQCTQKEIAQTFNVTRQRVNQVLKKYKIACVVLMLEAGDTSCIYSLTAADAEEAVLEELSSIAHAERKIQLMQEKKEKLQVRLDKKQTIIDHELRMGPDRKRTIEEDMNSLQARIDDADVNIKFHANAIAVKQHVCELLSEETQKRFFRRNSESPLKLVI